MRGFVPSTCQGSGCARSGSCADGADVRGSIGAVPCAAQIPDMKAAPRPCSRRPRTVCRRRCSPGGCDGQVCRARCNRFGRSGLRAADSRRRSEKAIEKGSTVLYDGHKDNVAYRWELEGGDLKAAFKNADKVVKQRIVNQRLIPVAMETRGVVAEYKPGERQLTVWSRRRFRTYFARKLRPCSMCRAFRAGDHAGSRRRIWKQAQRVC